MSKFIKHITFACAWFVLLFFLSALVACCRKEKEKPAEAFLPDTPAIQKYKENVNIVLASEVLDTGKVYALLRKPENKGKVFTNFEESFALVTPIKWDGKSALLDDIAYELTEEQMLKIDKNSSVPEFVRLQRMKAGVDSNKGAAGHYKTIIYKQGGGILIVHKME